MRVLIFLVLAIVPTFSYAEPIITDIDKVDKLYDKVRVNPFFLKVGPAKFEIFYFEVGRAQTPFYERSSQIKRFYKNENKCFELTVFETVNIARKVGCYDKTQDLYLQGFEEFKAVTIQSLLDEGLQGFKTNEFSQTYELQAFVQTIDTYTMDRAVYGEMVEQTAPRIKFKSYLKGMNEVVLKKKEGFQLLQNLELTVDKIGILSPKTIQSSNSIRLNAGGLIFSNAQGKVLLYNPVLPRPFGDYELTLNPKLPALLEVLATQSQTTPVCYRDDYVSSSPKDCHRIIFGTYAPGNMNKVKILAIDFLRQKIEFLK
jgi:hypothetical protein